MKGTFLITSGAYTSPDFISTFGLLPPAFLPVGNRRLYDIQLDLISEIGSRKFLSIPEDFEIANNELNHIKNIGLNLISVPLGLSLGASVSYVLEHCNLDEGELRILHGDTLVLDFPFLTSDIVSVGITNEYYSWAEYNTFSNEKNYFSDGLPEGAVLDSPQGNRSVLSGYFCFSNGRLYHQCLKRKKDDFIPSLNEYNQERPLAPLNKGKWLDFGHLDQYYQSKATITTERVFNKLEISQRTVKKSSKKQNKIKAESSWFSNLPNPLKLFAPQFLGDFSTKSDMGYETEYLYLSTLSELSVFGRLPAYVWQRIFQSCDDFLVAAQNFKPNKPPKDPNQIYLAKTEERLSLFAFQSDISLKQSWIYDGKKLPCLNNIAEIVAGLIPTALPNHFQVIHGDLCFSNILYDFRANIIRLVDPRGEMPDGTQSIYGDIRYDIAKLYQSVIGGYEFIITGQHELEDISKYELKLNMPFGKEVIENQNIFLERTFAGYTHADAASKPITILLFLSMLALHHDRLDRQRAFVANALRLYADLDR